jgi:carbon-monoxide dehydrogenase medium subunit
MIPAVFDYLAPGSLADAMAVLTARGEDAKILAGGHSLLPLLKLRLASPKLLIDLSRIPELKGVREQDGKVVIGALTTHYQIESAALLKKRCPLLPETAREIGDVQVRNRGTIGGSLAHADPSADWPAAILALGGELLIIGPKGERRLSVNELFLGPMTTAIEANEVLAEIRVPTAQRRSGSAYLKMAQQASGFAIVGVAVSLRVDAKGCCEDVGIGVTGLSDKPFRAHAVEERLRGNKLTSKLIEASAAQVAEGVDVLNDLHASAQFRQHLAKHYASRAIRQALKRSGAILR